MTNRRNGQPHDGWIDELLALPIEPVADDGFAARVMAELPEPAPVDWRQLVSPRDLMLMLAAAALLVAGASTLAADGDGLSQTLRHLLISVAGLGSVPDWALLLPLVAGLLGWTLVADAT